MIDGKCSRTEQISECAADLILQGEEGKAPEEEFLQQRVHKRYVNRDEHEVAGVDADMLLKGSGHP